MKVNEIQHRVRRGYDDGAAILCRRFQVRRTPASDSHIVEVEVTEGITPQSERCDCRGYQYRRTCSHIDAVYSAGLFGGEVEA